MCISRFIASVPAVVWGAIISSFLTLIGVILINWNNNSRLLTQLNRESEEKARDRLGVLRRDVYLVAAGEAVKAINTLGRLPSLPPEQMDSPGLMVDFFVAMSKLQLVAEMKSTMIAAEFLGEFTKLLFKLMIKSMPIHDINNELEIKMLHYNRIQSEIERILAKMKEINESGTKQSEAFEILNKSFTHEQREANKISSERAKLFDNKILLHIEFSKNLLADLLNIQNLLMKLMIEIRHELGIDSNADEYARQMGFQAEKMRIAMDQMIKDLSAQISDRPTPPAPTPS